MSESILITGATGFIGWHLAVESLRRRYRTHLVLRPDSGSGRLKSLPKTPLVHVHDGTMRDMMSIMSKAKPTAILHAAALVLPTHTSADVDRLIKSNILFSTQLVEAAARTGVRSFINTGTFWQHYRDSDYDPVCLYAATKQAFEAILQFYVNINAIRAITLTLSDTYGSHDPRMKLFNSLVHAAKNGEVLPMSPGRQKLDLVDVRDISAAYFQAVQLLKGVSPSHNGKTYAVSSGVHVSLRRVVSLFNQISCHPARIKWGGRPYRDREVMRPWKGPRLPGWRVRIKLAQGMRDFLRDTNLMCVDQALPRKL